MDQSKCSHRFRLNAKVPMVAIKRRLIEIAFSIFGYLIAKDTKQPPILGTLFGGLVGMIISYLLLPEKTSINCLQAKPLSNKVLQKKEK